MLRDTQMKSSVVNEVVPVLNEAIGNENRL